MDKEKVLQMLAQEWQITPIKENELTAQDIMQALKQMGSVNSKEYVYRKLKDLIDSGVLQRREARRRNGNGKQLAYSPAEGKTWEDVLQYIKTR